MKFLLHKSMEPKREPMFVIDAQLERQKRKRNLNFKFFIIQ